MVIVGVEISYFDWVIDVDSGIIKFVLVGFYWDIVL